MSKFNLKSKKSQSIISNQSLEKSCIQFALIDDPMIHNKSKLMVKFSNKKRKTVVIPSTKSHQQEKKYSKIKPKEINDEIILNILSFFDANFNNLNTFQNINSQWNIVSNRWFLKTSEFEMRKISHDMIVGKCMDSNKKSMKRVKYLMGENKVNECTIFLRKIIPLNEYILDRGEPDFYHPNGIMEYMILKYGDFSRDSVKINVQENHTELINHFLYCLFELNHHHMIVPIIQKLLKNYNPVSTFMRLEMIETFKKNKNLRELFIETQKCLQLAYKPKDIAKCFRNFSYYYIEKSQDKEAIITLLKSAQFDTNMTMIRQLKHISDHILQTKILLIEKDMEDLNQKFKLAKSKFDRFQCETISKMFETKKQLKIVKTQLFNLCKHFQKQFIDFIVQKRIYPLQEDLLQYISENQRVNVFENYNMDQIPMYQEKKTNVGYFVPMKKSEKKPKNIKETINKKCNKILKLRSVHNREVFKISSFPFDEKTKKYINKCLSSCNMHVDEFKIMDCDNMIHCKMFPSFQIIKNYELLIELQETRKESERLKMFSDQAEEKDDFKKIKNIIDSNVFWENDHFMDLHYMKCVVKLMKDNSF